ncbi:M6 family metalloprotease domain-containing protein [Prevotella sp.]|uniref:M6 family metalloprotease domain-containing protein n=1 Tax=Prevotella sp. TaxID=59823 RepID=UPI0025FFDC6D|nr:M6 family metalloprotease domain-containing protein [Prevotella sp.]
MKKIIAMLSLALAASTTFAVPAKQAKKTLTLADGTQVVATLMGDEYMNWWQADNGMRYVESQENEGVYVAANMDIMTATAEMRRAQVGEKRAKRLNSVRKAADLSSFGGQQRVQIGDEHVTYEGKKKGIIILVQFPNQKFEEGHDNAYYKMVANEKGLTHKDGYVGSVSDYFLSQSNGKFELDFDIAGPYTLSHTSSYYGKNDGANIDVKVGYMIQEGCDAAVADGFNFNDYDWDGDGYADQVFVLYAGLGEASGGDAKTVWPHEYQIRYTCVGKVLNYTTEGKGKVDTYACANEMERVINEYTGQYTNDQKLAGIGTICHEFSHCLGFADMYDTSNGGNYGMGFFDVMSSGSYNGGGFVPCNYTAYERIYAGWTEPIVLEDHPASVKAMKSTQDYGRPFIIYNDKHKDEFYTLENREKKGWDAALYGGGMMITHVDYDQTKWGVNKVNDSASDHQRCTIFHADNDDNGQDLGSIQNDLYPYMSGGMVMNDELTDDSRPAAKLYNRNADGTKYMGKPVTAIRKNADGTMSFDFMGGSEENILDNTTKKEETAIKDIKADTRKADNRVYSIDGRYLGDDINALGKGLYIVGGKKELKTK